MFSLQLPFSQPSDARIVEEVIAVTKLMPPNNNLYGDVAFANQNHLSLHISIIAIIG